MIKKIGIIEIEVEENVDLDFCGDQKLFDYEIGVIGGTLSCHSMLCKWTTKTISNPTLAICE